jgi:hypothetical protein
MWIPTLEGYVNSDHVVDMSTNVRGDTLLHLVNGKTAVSSGASDTDQIAAGLNPIIPAQPGFEVLYLNYPGEEPAFTREPVIAWCVNPFDVSGVVAVTPEWSTLRSSNGVAILYPDGQVYSISNERTFSNVDEWVDGERKAEAAQKAKAI